MNGKNTILLALSIAMVMACVGVGYATEYSASTENTDNTLSSTYMVVKLNDGMGEVSYIFTFDDLVYYRDTAVTSTGVTTVYKSYVKVSDRVWMYIDGSESMPVSTALTVRLNSSVTDADLTIQFYDDANCTVLHENHGPYNLTTSDQSVGSYNTDTHYYCKITLTMMTTSMDAVPSGDISFGLTFIATAEGL